MDTDNPSKCLCVEENHDYRTKDEESVRSREHDNFETCSSASHLELRKNIENPDLQNEDVNCIQDIYRTGAKCVPDGLQDSHELGSAYHNVGALRTKPGRGDPTLSMSCSDKMMKWCVLGKVR